MPSLADEIAELLNPAPKDGDDDDEGLLTKAERPMLMTDDERAAAARVGGGRRLRGSSIQMSTEEEARYAGRKVSRAELSKRHALRLPAEKEDGGDGVVWYGGASGRVRRGRAVGVNGVGVRGGESEDGSEEGSGQSEGLSEEGSGLDGESGEEEEESGEEGQSEEKREAEGESGEEGGSGDSESRLRHGPSRRLSGDGDADLSLYSAWSKVAEGESAILDQLRASRTDEVEAAAQAQKQHVMCVSCTRPEIA
jgi:hypothetical protein